MIPVLMAGVAILSSPSLGIAEGTCRDPEPGPAIVVDVVGLKDRQGMLRLELYPPRNDDFLADDNVLLAAGKTFARVVRPVPPSGAVRLCIRVPRAGTYALSLLHDRNSNHKFDVTSDGVGFAGNPKLGWSKPDAAQAAVTAGPGLTPIEIRLNYLHGLSMRPEAAQ